jgi:hypothetical protein
MASSASHVGLAPWRCGIVLERAMTGPCLAARRLRGTRNRCRASSQTAKEEPQPQAEEALGLFTLK